MKSFMLDKGIEIKYDENTYDGIEIEGLFGNYRITPMEKPNKKDINNPDNYSYKAAQLCYMQGCNNVAEWWIDEDTFGLCDKCFRKLDYQKEIQK